MKFVEEFTDILGFIRSLVGLRSQNPNLKVLVSIGGYNDYLLPIWSNIAANSDLRNNLASNVLSFLQINDLNGVGEWKYFSILEDLTIIIHPQTSTGNFQTSTTTQDKMFKISFSF